MSARSKREEAAAVREIARTIYERELNPEEFDRRCNAALADAESMEETVELVRWFQQRYPTPIERLRYVRRQYAAWTKRR